MELHEKIRLLRQTKGWSQADMANKLHLSPNGYGDIERGDTELSVVRLEQIVQVFEVSLIDLIGLNEKTILNFTNNSNSKILQIIQIQTMDILSIIPESRN